MFVTIFHKVFANFSEDNSLLHNSVALMCSENHKHKPFLLSQSPFLELLSWLQYLFPWPLMYFPEVQ